MITKLHVENFKALRGRHVVPIAPITLVYGPNSGGKSSLIQPLLLLKQSVDAGAFVARGKWVDLGSFQSCVWQHDVSRPIRLGVEVSGGRTWEPDEPRSGEWAWGNPTNVWLSFRSMKLESGSTARVRLEALRLSGKSETEGDFDLRLKFVPERRRAPDGSRYEFQGSRSRKWLKNELEKLGLPSSSAELERYGVKWGASLLPHEVERRPSAEEFSAHLEEISARLSSQEFSAPAAPSKLLEPVPWRGAQTLNEGRLRLESVLAGLRYLGPIRVRPARAYHLVESAAEWVGTSGEYSLQHLHRGLRTRVPRFQEDLFHRWLRELDIPYRFKVGLVGDAVLGDGIHATLVDERTKTSVGLADVGAGVGQVLPILVQAAFSGAETVCVEQPELHLHPRAQAALGDVIRESATDSGTGWPNQGSTQWIIETHSETLLLRLKRRIREGKLDPLAVVVLYVQPGKSGSTVKEIRLDEKGDFLDEWPKGFFEEAFDEVFS